jgi:hypothetical protein
VVGHRLGDAVAWGRAARGLDDGLEVALDAGDMRVFGRGREAGGGRRQQGGRQQGDAGEGGLQDGSPGGGTLGGELAAKFVPETRRLGKNAFFERAERRLFEKVPFVQAET